jgi:hypothetical protein
MNIFDTITQNYPDHNMFIAYLQMDIDTFDINYIIIDSSGGNLDNIYKDYLNELIFLSKKKSTGDNSENKLNNHLNEMKSLSKENDKKEKLYFRDVLNIGKINNKEYRNTRWDRINTIKNTPLEKLENNFYLIFGLYNNKTNTILESSIIYSYINISNIQDFTDEIININPTIKKIIITINKNSPNTNVKSGGKKKRKIRKTRKYKRKIYKYTYKAKSI